MALDNCDFRDSTMRKHYDNHYESDPVGQSLAAAFRMVNACNPTERESARNVARFLKKRMQEYDNRGALP